MTTCVLFPSSLPHPYAHLKALNNYSLLSILFINNIMWRKSLLITSDLFVTCHICLLDNYVKRSACPMLKVKKKKKIYRMREEVFDNCYSTSVLLIIAMPIHVHTSSLHMKLWILGSFNGYFENFNVKII